MRDSLYTSQVALLLQVLPEVALEDCFALHGGTAINLFVRNMPWLSVDIGLTYLHLENREQSLRNISQALERIKARLEKAFPKIAIVHLEKESKLLIRHVSVEIKIEVNQIKRGCFSNPIFRSLCTKAQEDFNAFCEIQVVEIGHLFGGKICAAIDRQHPRDLFDIRYMLQNEGFTEAIKKGFLFYLISSNRPIVEMLFPQLLDQRAAFDNQFIGMAIESFTYHEFEQTREELIKKIHSSLDDKDKDFIIQLESGTPNWSSYDFGNFPAIRWKLLNLEKFKKESPTKHRKTIEKLSDQLENIR